MYIYTYFHNPKHPCKIVQEHMLVGVEYYCVLNFWYYSSREYFRPYPSFELLVLFRFPFNSFSFIWRYQLIQLVQKNELILPTQNELIQPYSEGRS